MEEYLTNQERFQDCHFPDKESQHAQSNFFASPEYSEEFQEDLPMLEGEEEKEEELQE